MIEQNAFSIIFGVFLMFTCRDVFFSQAGQQANPEQAKPVTARDHHRNYVDKHSSSLDGMPHINTIPDTANIRIQYCQSCGYRQAFEDISKMLQTHYPDIRVEGEIHKPNFLRSTMANFLFMAKIAVLGMIYMEFNPFTYFQLETPGIWTYMLRSKISSTLFIIFVSNSIENNMMSTGAFEIFYNDLPIWSKIETGRMPSVPELLQTVQSQRAFGMKRVGEFVPT